MKNNLADQMEINFQNRLKLSRERLGITQSELAWRTGLKTSAISHFERGARKPSIDNLKKLIVALHISADWLLENYEALSKPCSKIGKKIYIRCARCNKTIRANKPLLGGFHICAGDDND